MQHKANTCIIVTDWSVGESLKKTSSTINISDFGGGRTAEGKLLSSAFYQQNSTHTHTGKSDGRLWLTNWSTASVPLRQSLSLSQRSTASLEIHGAAFQTTPPPPPPRSWRRRTVDAVGRTLRSRRRSTEPSSRVTGQQRGCFHTVGRCNGRCHTLELLPHVTRCEVDDGTFIIYKDEGEVGPLEETKTSCKYFGKPKENILRNINTEWPKDGKREMWLCVIFQSHQSVVSRVWKKIISPVFNIYFEIMFGFGLELTSF